MPPCIIQKQISLDIGWLTSVIFGNWCPDRNEYGDIIDNMLYRNEDSYASQRLYYLQRRRFDLNNNKISDDDLGNPYEDE